MPHRNSIHVFSEVFKGNSCSFLGFGLFVGCGPELRARLSFTPTPTKPGVKASDPDPGEERLLLLLPNILKMSPPAFSTQLSIQVTGSSSVRTKIRFVKDEPHQPPQREAPDSEVSSTRTVFEDLLTKVSANALDISQQVADNAEMAYMSILARKTLFAGKVATQKTALTETISARTAEVAESLATAKLAENLSARKAVIADGLAAQTASLAQGLATRKAALADVTNQVAKRTHERTQQVAAGLAARKATLAGSAHAQKATQILGDAVETSASVLSEAKVRAGAVATTVTEWANAALDESRVFASMQ